MQTQLLKQDLLKQACSTTIIETAASVSVELCRAVGMFMRGSSGSEQSRHNYDSKCSCASGAVRVEAIGCEGDLESLNL